MNEGKIKVGWSQLVKPTPVKLKIISRTFTLLAGLIGGATVLAGYPIVGIIAMILGAIATLLADMTGLEPNETLKVLIDEAKQEAVEETKQEAKEKIDEI